jgi:hypothetical protein
LLNNCFREVNLLGSVEIGFTAAQHGTVQYSRQYDMTWQQR